MWSSKKYGKPQHMKGVSFVLTLSPSSPIQGNRVHYSSPFSSLVCLLPSQCFGLVSGEWVGVVAQQALRRPNRVCRDEQGWKRTDGCGEDSCWHYTKANFELAFHKKNKKIKNKGEQRPMFVGQNMRHSFGKAH